MPSVRVGARTRSEYQRSEYQQIVAAVHPILVHRAMCLTRDKDDACDLVQATLEKGYRAFGNFQVGTNAAGWLSRIMTNYFIDEVRRRRPMRFAVPIDKLEIPAPPPERPLPWANLGEEEVRAAASRLPDHCRIPFELRSFERLSYREIADRLGLPINTICTRIYRARQQLKQLLLERITN